MAEPNEGTSLLSRVEEGTPFIPSQIAGKTWAGEDEGPDAAPKDGTIISSAMNLAACALGASMLSLPYAMMVSGPVVSFSLLLSFGVMSYIAADAIVQAGRRCSKSSYAAIVEAYLGKTHGVICNILLSCALAVAAISYIVGLRDLMPNLIGVFANVPKPARVIGVLVTLFPVTLIGSLAAFGSASTFAAVGCYVQAFALIFQLRTADLEKTVGEPLPEKLFTFDFFGVLFSLPMVCFVFAFHYVLTDTLSEVNNPTEGRLAKVSLTTIAILLGCYIPVSVSGYLLVQGRCAKNNLLECLPPDSPAVLIANWSIGLLLFITYSLFIIPLRRKIEGMILEQPTKSMFHPVRLAVAGFLACTIGTVSIALTDLGLANTLAGACISLVMFFYPGYLMVQSEYDLKMEERPRGNVVKGFFFMAVGATICLSGLFGHVVFKEEKFGEIPAILEAGKEAIKAAFNATGATSTEL